MRPNKKLEGSTVGIKTSCGRMYITINKFEDKFIECFINMGKAGGCEAAFNESLGRMIALHLQKGGEIDDIIKMLIGIRCNKPFKGGTTNYLSCTDALAQVLLEQKRELNKEDV